MVNCYNYRIIHECMSVTKGGVPNLGQGRNITETRRSLVLAPECMATEEKFLNWQKESTMS